LHHFLQTTIVYRCIYNSLNTVVYRKVRAYYTINTMTMEQNTIIPSETILSPKKAKFPIGMIVVLIVLVWGIVVTLFRLPNLPLFQFGPIMSRGGYTPTLISIVVMAAYGASFYGTLMRRIWARKLVIGWYLIHMGILVLNFAYFLMDKQGITRLYKESFPVELIYYTEQTIAVLLTSSMVTGLIAGIAIISYVYRKRDFFIN
jgi:hypothetical protein